MSWFSGFMFGNMLVVDTGTVGQDVEVVVCVGGFRYDLDLTRTMEGGCCYRQEIITKLICDDLMWSQLGMLFPFLCVFMKGST